MRMDKKEGVKWIIIGIAIALSTSFANWIASCEMGKCDSSLFNLAKNLGIILAGFFVLFWVIPPIFRKFVKWVLPKWNKINIFAKINNLEIKVKELEDNNKTYLDVLNKLGIDEDQVKGIKFEKRGNILYYELPPKTKKKS